MFEVPISLFEQVSPTEWQVAPTGAMRVPAVIFATEDLIRDMDDKVFQQITNVAALPGIVRAAYTMPDAHWGYGFPIGGGLRCRCRRRDLGWRRGFRHFMRGAHAPYRPAASTRSRNVRVISPTLSIGRYRSALAPKARSLSMIRT